MKKIIRYLADITGVSQDIRRETIVEIGGRLHGDGYWFNKLKPVMNMLQKMGDHLKDDTHWQISEIRKELYKDLGIKE